MAVLRFQNWLVSMTGTVGRVPMEPQRLRVNSRVSAKEKGGLFPEFLEHSFQDISAVSPPLSERYPSAGEEFLSWAASPGESALASTSST